MTTKNKIPLTLTAQQRNLLLKNIHQIADEKTTQLIAIALNKDDQYEIYMTEEQLDDLSENLCSISNNEEDILIQSELDDLADHIEETNIKYCDDEDISRNTGSVFELKVALEGSKKDMA